MRGVLTAQEPFPHHPAKLHEPGVALRIGLDSHSLVPALVLHRVLFLHLFLYLPVVPAFSNRSSAPPLQPGAAELLGGCPASVGPPPPGSSGGYHPRRPGGPTERWSIVVGVIVHHRHLEFLSLCLQPLRRGPLVLLLQHAHGHRVADPAREARHPVPIFTRVPIFTHVPAPHGFNRWRPDVRLVKKRLPPSHVVLVEVALGLQPLHLGEPAIHRLRLIRRLLRRGRANVRRQALEVKIDLVVTPQVMKQGEMLGPEVVSVPLEEERRVPTDQTFEVSPPAVLVHLSTAHLSGHAGWHPQVIQAR